ncbi:uncharacterized protein PAC_09554 [Phialocephala subalpina]|uniref:Uncharacterized protein n=1 Tax=Phialocephala subalpina TaxID=576137 RepID=A0A1L7X3Q8_9HELO|nr:uncharacterized protein PAC_09554 [Phialocephala subalpina]
MAAGKRRTAARIAGDVKRKKTMADKKKAGLDAAEKDGPSEHTPEPTSNLSNTTKEPRIASAKTSAPKPTHVYEVKERIQDSSRYGHDQNISHGMYFNLEDANSKVYEVRLSYEKEGQYWEEYYTAEIVNGALSWSVPWENHEAEGEMDYIEMGVKKVKVKSSEPVRYWERLWGERLLVRTSSWGGCVGFESNWVGIWKETSQTRSTSIPGHEGLEILWIPLLP